MDARAKGSPPSLLGACHCSPRQAPLNLFRLLVAGCVIEPTAHPVRKHLVFFFGSDLPSASLFVRVAELVHAVKLLLASCAFSLSAFWHLLHVSAVYMETFDNAIAFSYLTLLNSYVQYQ